MTDPSFQFWTAHRVGPNRGVRGGRYKLIEYYTEGNYWELFDLLEDPHELNNLYGQPGQAELIEDLTKQLRDLQNTFHESG